MNKRAEMGNLVFRRSLFGAFSFVFIYCWYNAYWRHFDLSPVAQSLGQLAGFAEVVVSFGTIAGVIISLFNFWPRLVEQNPAIKAIVHLLAFMPFWFLPFCQGAVAITICGVVGGFFIGAVMVRSLFSMFFEVMDYHPVTVIVVGYAIIQCYIHLSDIIPLTSVPPLYYALAATTLGVALLLSFFRFNGEEMERRRILPDTNTKPRDIWQILAMIVLVQTCLTLYDVILLMQAAPKGAFGEAINIIPDVLMLLFLALFGKRLKMVYALVAFLALFLVTIAMFMIFKTEARIPMQLFMEPAYRMVDLLFVWSLIVVFISYGRDQLRLKLCLGVFFAVKFGTLVLFGAVFRAIPPVTETALLCLIPALLAALLIPSTMRSLERMEALRAYAEEQKDVVVPLSPNKEEVQLACEDLEQTLPEGVTLTALEHDALAYIIDDLDKDVTAYFMGIEVKQIRELNASIWEKFGVKSNRELMVELGVAQAGAHNTRKREAFFNQYGLTDREREVAECLLSGMPAKSIPHALGISQGTVNFHSQNLYRKLGIQSRAELSSMSIGFRPAANSGRAAQ